MNLEKYVSQVLLLTPLSAYTLLPVWPLKICPVSPPGPVTNKLIYFTLHCGLLVKLGLFVTTLELYLTNVNLRKKSQHSHIYTDTYAPYFQKLSESVYEYRE